MEFTIGALASIGAGFFTNPLEVVKTRLQLQGELKKKGQYSVHYRNFVHAFFVIGKTDGLLALQKGLVPALCHQVLLNGVRLGGYQLAEERKLNLKENGEISLWRTFGIGAAMGAVGAYTGSPLYLVKTRLQSQASVAIAVGHQHREEGMVAILRSAYGIEGLQGLWRGVTGAVPRLAVGSACQLTTFYICKEWLETNEYWKVEKGLLNTFLASMMGGIVVAIFMGPLDVVSTRLYNQGVGPSGQGLLYNGYFDCIKKIWSREGLPAFYKGIGPCYARIGPHTVLCFVFWDHLKRLHQDWLRQTERTISLSSA